MIKVTCEAATMRESEPEADQDIAAFDQFVQRNHMGEPLDKHERAIIKTYLAWKMWPDKLVAREEGAAVEPDAPVTQGLRF